MDASVPFSRSRRIGARHLASAASVVLASLAGLGLAQPVSAEAVWDQATPAVFATGVQHPTPDAQFRSVSCASAGNCTAVGNFKNGTGGYEALSMTSTNGVWGQATPAVFATGVQHPNPDADFRSVSCASAGNCTAVGTFLNVSGFGETFTMTSTNGIWAQATGTAFPAGMRSTSSFRHRLDSVSCASPGNCTAVGGFGNTTGGAEAFTMTSTNGIWGQPSRAVFPSNVQHPTPDAQFRSVSCVSAGNCTAVGYYLPTTSAASGPGRFQLTFTMTSTNGVWAQATPVAFAPGVQNTSGDATLWSVSCTSAGNCTAVGGFNSLTSGYQAYTVTSINGVWAQATPVAFGSVASNYSELHSVSCSADGHCTAAGQFQNSRGWTQAFAVSSTNGTWGEVAPAAFASGVENSNQNARLSSVSCTSTGGCATVGYFRNAIGDTEAFAMTGSTSQGTTSTGTPIVLPPPLPTAAPVTTTTNPPTTTTSPPTTTLPAPVPGNDGALPSLAPGGSQVLDDGVVTPVEIFVQNSTDLVVRSGTFQINLTGECSYGCTIATDPDGRHVLELEQDGRARATGQGFLPDTPVYVWLFSEPTLLGQLTVEADGTFDGSVSLVGIEPGQHTLQLTGTSTDGTRRTANLGVLVSPQGGPTPLPGVLPATGSTTNTTTALWAILLSVLGAGITWAGRRHRGVVGDLSGEPGQRGW